MKQERPEKDKRRELLIKALTGRADVYEHTGNYGSSMHDIEEAIKHTTDEIQRIFLRLKIAGILANKENNYEEAAKIVNSVQNHSGIMDKHSGIHTKTLEIMASILEGRGELEASKKYYEKIVNITKDEGDKVKLALTYNQIGLVYESMGNYKKAIYYFKKAYSIFLQKSDKLGMAIVLGNTGIVYWDTGKTNKAIELFKEYLAVSEQIGFKSGMAVAYGNIAMVLEDSGDFKKALTYYRKSLQISREIGEKRELSVVLENIGSLYSSIGNFNRAMQFFKMSLAIATELQDKVGISSLYQEMGNIYQVKGAFKKAVEFYEKSLRLAYKAGFRLGMADAHYCMARGFIRLEKYSEANIHVGKAMQIYKEIQSIVGMSWCYAAKSECAIIGRELKRAVIYAKKSISMAQDAASEKCKIYPLRLLGKALFLYNFCDKSKLQEAFMHFKNSISIARKLDLRFELALSLYEIGMAYKSIGELKKSETYLKEANSLFDRMKLSGYVRHLKALWQKTLDLYSSEER